MMFLCLFMSAGDAGKVYHFVRCFWFALLLLQFVLLNNLIFH
ncbi:hypothetical protein BARBAKC583_0191 [Bartonella bacilliformis KC583]|uniref:Uncharacterized protein n=1 Tax=Bartonella bacilliformis (strain ATCC 35685 / KC583 / Herrer 020/F12,63) TaxID=360095 RepID=A1URC5_BARBK|nr:hypothetical protein BARBAKC583_0191 [Bartonella bacilliformis KC583]